MPYTFADLILDAARSQEAQQPLLPLGPIPHPPIRAPKAPQLTRDQRRDYQLLHGIGWTHKQINNQFPQYTIRQIQRAYAQNPTP